MSAKIILGIIGEMGAGKSTITSYLKEKYGAVTFRFSDMLGDILERLHIEPARENFQDLSTALRQTFGEDIMSQDIARDVAEAAADFIITEGVRRPTDVAYLRALPGYRLVSLVAAERTRYERLLKRSEKTDDQTKTWADFQKEGQKETETKIKEVAAGADFIVDNNGPLEELYRQMDEIVAKLRATA